MWYSAVGSHVLPWVVPGGTWRFGIEAVAVAVSAAVIAWRGSLLARILLAVAGVAAGRALGW